MKIKDAIYLIEPSKKQDKKYDVYMVSFSKLNTDIPKSWRKYTMDGLDKDDIVKKYNPYGLRDAKSVGASDTRYIVSFGQKGMEQYKDKFEYYKYLDHNDKKRKDAYRARHKNDNINDPNFAGYWSWNYLWS